MWVARISNGIPASRKISARRGEDDARIIFIVVGVARAWAQKFSKAIHTWTAGGAGFSLWTLVER